VTPRAHRGPSALVAATVVAVALTVSACGGPSAQSLAAQACVHVHRSVAAFRQSTEPGMAQATAASLRRKADAELSVALPLAAQANSADGSWNALMTTISESATVDEQHLVPALQAQCAVAAINQNVNPEAPPTQNVNPQSPSP
jgi:hypothetical protein